MNFALDLAEMAKDQRPTVPAVNGLYTLPDGRVLKIKDGVFELEELRNEKFRRGLKKLSIEELKNLYSWPAFSGLKEKISPESITHSKHKLIHLLSRGAPSVFVRSWVFGQNPERQALRKLLKKAKYAGPI
jgi:hypothetical protein